MVEFDLIESKELREKCANHYEVLEKVKQLLLVEGTEIATIKQIAEYYDVGEEAVKTIVKRHDDELLSDGMERLSGSKTKEYFRKVHIEPSETMRFGFVIDGNIFNNKGNLLFPRRAILRVGMLLRDSEIAKEVRTQLLNIEEKASDKVKISDITEEQSLMIAVGMAMSSGDVNALGIASTNLVAFKNRHISQLEENNSKLEEDNKLLANGILEWSDRKNLNFGVRKLAGATHIQFGNIWSELYKQLHYKYGINLKARNNGHKPYIENIKESEWDMVVKSFSAMCESYNQSPTEMLQQKVFV